MIPYPFTAVPNWFFQVAPTLKEAELRIMLQVWFDTAGRQKDQNILAYSYIAETTGVTGTSAISNALKTLESRNLITRTPGRVAGQKITVFPNRPPAGVPEVLLQEESTTPAKRVTTPAKRVDYSSKKSHNKNQPESMNLESTTESAVNLESIEEDKAVTLLLLSYGINSTTISELIPKLRKNGRDISYLRECWGYVASLQPKNPPGYLITLIARNAGIPYSKGAQGPSKLNLIPTYHYADVGELELIQHNGPRAECAECQKGESAQNG